MEITQPGGGGSGASLTVTDGITPVTNVSTIDFTSGATVTNGGGGQANVAISGSGTGTVTTVSVVSANGLAGTVANATTTPAITLSTTINAPVLAGNGTAISAATTTGSGSTVVLAASPTLTTAVLGSSTATTQSPGDASTKVATTAYVDAAVQGTDAKDACKYATTGVLPTVVYNNGASGVGATLTAVGVGALNLDSATPSVADRILVKNQVSTFQNGIYVVTAVGSGIAVFVMTRATDFDQAADIDIGDSVFITAGTINTNTTWVQNGTNSPVMGTDPITFAQIAGPGSITSGNGITVTGLSVAIDTSVTVDKTTAQTLTNKTLTAPIISTISNTGTVTLPTATDTLVARATTDTLTNKRNQPRTASSTTASTLTPDLSAANVYYRTTQTATLTVNAPTGTPVIGEVIAIYVDAAGAQTLTMDATYIPFGAAFPASLTAGKTCMITAQFNGTNWKTLIATAV